MTPAPPLADLLAAVDRARALRKGFILGCAKSGTTWLQNLLAGHPQAAVAGEGAFAWRLAPTLIHALRQFNDHQRKTGQPTVAMVDDEEAAVLLRTAIELRWARYVQASPAWRTGRPTDLRLVCDKTPQHTVGLPLLETLCPGARYVHIVRDPRDAAVSAWFHFGKAEGRTFEAFIAHYVGVVWPTNVNAARKESSRLGPRWLEVRYEALHDDEIRWVRRILEHLDLDAGDDIVAACITSGDFRERSGGRDRGETKNDSFYRRGVTGDWREQIPSAAAAKACAPVAELMRSCGYDPLAA